MKEKLYDRTKITTITIGGFDGMHLAHQELFKRLGTKGAIVVIQTKYANLTPKRNREKYTHYPIEYYQLEDIKHLSGIEFLDLLLKKFVSLEKIIVGFDFKFAKNASCTIEDLKRLFKGDVEIVDEYYYQDIPVHSKTIRNYIENSDIKIANKLLSRNYCIKGNHIKGQGLGKKQFVPTINIQCDEFLLPSAGIYATYTIVNNTKYKSVSFLGHRVSTDGKYAIETHILDKDIQDINTEIKIEFIDKIRDNKLFENVEDLKKMILEDIKVTKSILKS